MRLIGFDPMREFAQMREGLEYMNRVFENFEKGSVENGERAFRPVVNTREANDAYYIEADLPGVKKGDISIDIDENILTISGERRVEKEREEDEFYRVESVYGRFERSFSLPEDVDVEKIEAQMENGVLKVRIPKAQRVDKAPKKIEIK
jgi:HSP20 family protein